MKTKLLFALDLDGTVLSNSATREMHPATVKGIKRAVREGHVVCILTGRPWKATKSIYNELGLNTIVVNYNGAYLHNPNPESEFLPVIKMLDLNDVLYILGNKYLKKSHTNLALEGPSWVMIEKREKKLEQVFGINLSNNIKVGLDFSRIPLKPTGVIIDTKKDIDAYKLVKYLRRKYGDLAEFTAWSKGRNESLVIDITAPNAKKNNALSLLCRFYDIPIHRTIAFGDNHNDKEMLEAAGMGVAMKNGSSQALKAATDVTKFDNEEGGVGIFIDKILDNFEKTVRELDEHEVTDFALEKKN